MDYLNWIVRIWIIACSITLIYFAVQVIRLRWELRGGFEEWAERKAWDEYEKLTFEQQAHVGDYIAGWPPSDDPLWIKLSTAVDVVKAGRYPI